MAWSAVLRAPARLMRRRRRCLRSPRRFARFLRMQGKAVSARLVCSFPLDPEESYPSARSKITLSHVAKNRLQPLPSRSADLVTEHRHNIVFERKRRSLYHIMMLVRLARFHAV
jgi:hypothetical protein